MVINQHYNYNYIKRKTELLHMEWTEHGQNTIPGNHFITAYNKNNHERFSFVLTGFNAQGGTYICIFSNLQTRTKQLYHIMPLNAVEYIIMHENQVKQYNNKGQFIDTIAYAKYLDLKETLCSEIILEAYTIEEAIEKYQQSRRSIKYFISDN